MEAIPIRTARRADIPMLVALWGAMAEENARLDPRLAVHPDAREHMARSFAAWVEDDRRTVQVAEESRRLVVGFAAGVLSTGDGLREPVLFGQVTDCFVAPARRRRGTGRRLVGRVHDLLKERGAQVVRLQYVVRNEAARAFWTSLGYEPVEEILERAVRPVAPPP